MYYYEHHIITFNFITQVWEMMIWNGIAVHWQVVHVQCNNTYQFSYVIINISYVTEMIRYFSLRYDTSYFLLIFFYLICVLSCFVNEEMYRNDRGHEEHWYGVSPVWMRLCSVKWCLLRKLTLQTVQLYGLSFEWIRLCSWRCDLVLKLFLQMSQENFFKSVCVNWCLLKLPDKLNFLWHILHL